MKIPPLPTIQAISHFTPSLYEAALRCKARAIWSAFGDRNAIPQNSTAILGTCFHKVLELAHKGKFPQDKEACREAARQEFDLQSQLQYQQSHPLIRSKYSSVERLPRYYLLRERAALHASDITLERTPSTPRETSKPSGSSEVSLRSQDGLIKGRPDYINVANSTIIDYKSGFKTEADEAEISESEARQLRLYTYLCLENNIQISQGMIIRGDNQRPTLEITNEDARKEGDAARALLLELNDAASSQTFQKMAQPSPKNCKGCSCIPLCEAFWEQATPDWEDECGTHLEGRIVQTPISSKDSTFNLVNLEVNDIRGTISSTQTTIQQIPQDWLLLDGENIPRLGDIIRLVDAKHSKSESSSVVRAEKFLTTIWLK